MTEGGFQRANDESRERLARLVETLTPTQMAVDLGGGLTISSTLWRAGPAHTCCTATAIAAIIWTRFRGVSMRRQSPPRCRPTTHSCSVTTPAGSA